MAVERTPGPERPAIGWREWVAFPALGIQWIKAKVDTGARTSALHAHDIRTYRRGGRDFVRFKVHPIQRDSRTTVEAEALLLDQRKIRSSTGHTTFRPVIHTEVRILDRIYELELTLVARDEMGFRLLLGREAIRGRFVVDPGRSFLGGRKTRRKKKKTKKKKKAKKKVKRKGPGKKVRE